MIDAAGPSAVLAQSFSILRNGGKIVRIGYDPEPPRFSLNPMIEKGTWLKGHFGYDWVGWRNCIRLLDRGALRAEPRITHTPALSDWEKGYALTRSKEAVKVILIPD